jgi:hypothetical protein
VKLQLVKCFLYASLHVLCHTKIHNTLKRVKYTHKTHFNFCTFWVHRNPQLHFTHSRNLSTIRTNTASCSTPLSHYSHPGGHFSHELWNAHHGGYFKIFYSPAVDIDVYLVFVCCIVLCRYRPLRRADHSSRGVLVCV